MLELAQMIARRLLPVLHNSDRFSVSSFRRLLSLLPLFRLLSSVVDFLVGAIFNSSSMCFLTFTLHL